MKKTSVYLSDRERAHLAKLARTVGRSQSAIIREAILAFEAPCSPPREFASFDCGEGPGDSIENTPEEEYLKGFGAMPVSSARGGLQPGVDLSGNSALLDLPPLDGGGFPKGVDIDSNASLLDFMEGLPSEAD